MGAWSAEALSAVEPAASRIGWGAVNRRSCGGVCFKTFSKSVQVDGEVLGYLCADRPGGS